MAQIRAGSGQHTAATTAANCSIGKPSGLADGDWWVAVISIENDIRPAPPSSDWQVITNINHNTTALDLWVYAMYVPNAAAVSSVTFTHASSWREGSAFAVQGASSTARIRAGQPGVGTSTTIGPAPAITFAATSGLALFLAVTFGDHGGTMSQPTNYTEFRDSPNNLYIAERTMGASGSTGTAQSSHGSSQNWIAVHVGFEDVAYTADPAYPQIRETGPSQFGTSMGTQALNPPPNTQSGDLVLWLVANDNTGATNLTAGSTGWVSSAIAGTTGMETRLYGRVMTGLTGDNILSVTGAAQDWVALPMAIKDHGLDAAGLSTWFTNLVSSATGTSATADPPSETAATSAGQLVLAWAALDMGAAGDLITLPPANYAGISYRKSAASTSSCGAMASYRHVNGTTENPGTFTNTNVAWHAWTAMVPPVGTTTKSGSGDGAISWAGSATGTRTPKGAGNGAVSWVGSATGKKVQTGSASGAISWVGSSTGKRVPKAAANGAISWVGSATGTRTPKGAANGAVSWVGSATGTTIRRGAASGAVSWVGSSTGVRVPKGSATGAISWVGSATGEMPVVGPNDGSASGAITWAGSATGTRVSRGAVSGSIAWAGSATGRRASAGSVTGAISWVGSATGKRVPKASAAGAISWVGSATGESPGVGVNDGSANGTITWAGSATGRRTSSGSTSGTVTWVGSATGRRTSSGSATGAITWVGSATGERPIIEDREGSAAGAITWVGTATGSRLSSGSVTGLITWVGSATGEGRGEFVLPIPDPPRLNDVSGRTGYHLVEPSSGYHLVSARTLHRVEE